jgi:hypothetical protein
LRQKAVHVAANSREWTGSSLQTTFDFSNDQRFKFLNNLGGVPAPDAGQSDSFVCTDQDDTRPEQSRLNQDVPDIDELEGGTLVLFVFDQRTFIISSGDRSIPRSLKRHQATEPMPIESCGEILSLPHEAKESTERSHGP